MNDEGMVGPTGDKGLCTQGRTSNAPGPHGHKGAPGPCCGHHHG